MAEETHYETAPQDRISLPHKLIYGLGAFINNLLSAAINGMMIVLNLGLGMNPALVGLISAIPRLTDALTDPLMGYISDNTQTRWGRRRPYIFIGAILSALVFALLWQIPLGQSESYYYYHFLIGSFIFFLVYTIYATPWVALGYELTPDYHERTRLMGVQNFIGQLAYVIAPWFLLIMQSESMFDGMIDGAAGLAMIIAVVVVCVGVLPAIFLRERFKDIAIAEADAKKTPVRSVGSLMWNSISGFFTGFATTLRSKSFIKLCIATFLIFNSFMLIASFQFYVIIYYVFGGDTVLGAKYAGIAGTAGVIGTFTSIILVTWLSGKIGKRRAFFVTTSISILGFALKWVCYNPDIPWLVAIPAPLMAFGMSGLFTLMPSMIADVVDEDELETHERREGMFGSIFWWVVKLGTSAAFAASGFLLNYTGFDVKLEGPQSEQTIFLLRVFDAAIPIVASAIAIWAIATFSLTAARARDVRAQLEARRGVAAA